MEAVSTLAVALGSAWTSGINLYATVLALGLLRKSGAAALPGGLEVLDNWWIIGIAAALYLVEFFADKVPYIDSLWDVVHTFIRVPAGAVVAYAATNELDAGVTVAAVLLGGGFALGSHGTKAAVRMGANLSPEPVSNWILSVVEDVIAFLGAAAAVLAPLVLAAMLVLFLAGALWLGPKVLRAFRKLAKGAVALVSGRGWRAAARVAD